MDTTRPDRARPDREMHPVIANPADRAERMRSAAYRPRRRRWPGLLIAGLLGALIAGAMIANHYDGHSLGARIDAGIDAASNRVGEVTNAAKAAAGDAVTNASQAAESVNSVAADGAITAAVKAALATDPALSALQIDVTTRDGMVTLQGPAPDEKARQRAEVIAAAPKGVRGVDNRLVLPVAPAS
jgi:hyperosmotically inducible periplasmic protein